MTKKKRAKPITLETLAGMVQRGFGDVDDKLEGIAKQFEGVNKRLDDHDHHFKAIENRLDVHEGMLLRIREEVKGIRKEGMLNELALREVRTRLDRVERKLGLAK